MQYKIVDLVEFRKKQGIEIYIEVLCAAWVVGTALISGDGKDWSGYQNARPTELLHPYTNM